MKLKYKLSFIMTLFVLSIFLIGISIYVKSSNDTIIENSKIGLLDHARGMANGIQIQLKGKLDTAKTLSSSMLVAEFLEKSNAKFSKLSENKREKLISTLNEHWKNTGDINDDFIKPYLNNKLAQYLKNQQNILPNEYGEIFITNKYGTLVSSTGKLSTLSHAKKYWWKAAFNDGAGKFFFDDRGFDDSVNGYVLGIVVPIKKDGEIIGILKSNVNIISLLNIAVDSYGELDKGRFRIVRTKGLVVLEKGSKPLSSWVDPSVLKFLLKDKAGSQLVSDLGKKEIISYAPIDISSIGKDVLFGGKQKSFGHKQGNEGEIWHIVINNFKEDILIQSSKTNKIILYTGLVFIVFFACLAFFIGLYIAKPIEKLAKDVRLIDDKEENVKLDTSSNDEVGVLAQAFNEMIDNLKNTMISRSELLVEIQKRKDIEVELTNVKERYELAINGTQDGLWDWNVVKDTIYFSPIFKSILGYKDDEMPNMFEEWDKRVHAEDKQSAYKDIKDNQEGKTSVYENIHRLKHKDGHWVWVLDRGKTIFDEDGQAIRMIGFHTDITEKKNLENRLSKEIEKTNELGVIIKNSINEVYIFDKNTLKFIFVNECTLNHTGYSLDELLEKTPTDIKPLLTKDDFTEIVKPLVNREKEYVKFSTLHERKDKTTYPVDIILEHGMYEGAECYVAIVVDVTEREKMLQDIQDQEKIMVAQSRHAAMGEMIGMIAHQWRQPISVIAMGANNIIADVHLESVNDEELLEVSNEILEETEHLSKTIDDFRNFFKPNKDVEIVSVEDIFDETLKVIGKTLENSNIQLVKSFNTTKQIETYSRELLQVFINILKNAKEALIENRDEHRKIEVTLNGFSDGIVMCISDNAGGIEEDIIGNIFDPYFSTKDEKSGTGLGLYMSKTIIEKHLKGTIKVKNINEGVEFEIALPLSIGQWDRRKNEGKELDD